MTDCFHVTSKNGINGHADPGNFVVLSSTESGEYCFHVFNGELGIGTAW